MTNGRSVAFNLILESNETEGALQIFGGKPYHFEMLCY